MANWYLDAAVGSSGNGTSWGTAWKASSNVVWGASGVKAGDTLYVATGTYAPLTVGANGSAVSPITIRASQDTHVGVATFSGGGSGPALIAQSRSYITLDGQYGSSRNLTFQNGATSSSYNPILDFYQGGTGNRFLYLTIQNGKLGIEGSLHTPGASWELAYCYLYNLYGEAGIRMVPPSTDVGSITWGNSSIHHNEFYFPWYVSGAVIGIDCIQGLHGYDVYNNIFHGYNQTFSGEAQHPDVIQAQGMYWRIYNNHFYNWGDSAIDNDHFVDGTIQHWRIYNNVFSLTDQVSALPFVIRMYENGPTGYGTTKIDDLVIANNTFVDIYGGLYPIYLYSSNGPYNPVVTNTIIRNNLSYNSGVWNGYWLYIDPASNAVAANYNVDYNLAYAGPDGYTGLYVDGAVYTQSHPRTGQPLFVTYSKRANGNDFHLQAGDTVAKGQGVDLSAYFTTDKDGITRTGAWSIGAYQGSGGGATPPVGTPVLSVR
jgi:hypothetical protein